jgi:hypothetical protein
MYIPKMSPMYRRTKAWCGMLGVIVTELLWIPPELNINLPQAARKARVGRAAYHQSTAGCVPSQYFYADIA